MTEMEHIQALDTDTEARVEAGLKDKRYDELVSELATNQKASEYVSAQAATAKRRLDDMTAQGSLLQVRRQAIMDELSTRENA